MPSLISTSTRRGVLSELNVNSPVGLASVSPTGKATIGAEKSLLGETSLQKVIKESDMVDAVHGEAGVVGTKRRGNGLDEAVQRSPKKCKTDVGEASRRISDRRVRELSSGPVRGNISHEIKHSSSSLTPVRSHAGSTQTSSPVSVSPGSSNGFSETALNDTQITEPDESRVIPILTPAELRQSAQAIKLRLRLATYKVRTNQIDLPMSRLQIKTSMFDRLPSPRSKYTNPPRRTPLPSTSTSQIPDIRLQKPSAEKYRRTDIITSSPPPMLPTKKFQSVSPTKEEDTREELATPLLPRHRRGLLNPLNLGSPNWEGKRSPGTDLTSSVVKRGTADALLSLKLQR